MPPTNSKKRSGNPAVRNNTQPPQEDPYAPTTWGSSGTGSLEDIVLPSGQRALVRVIGVEGLIKAGVLQDLDSLTSLVAKEHVQRVEGRNGPETHIDMKSVMGDEEQMASITRVVDKVVVACVVKPEVHTTPDDITRREPGVIYADMIDLVDKMYLFQLVVGGTRDLESFRGELDKLLGGVAPEPEVSGAPQ